MFDVFLSVCGFSLSTKGYHDFSASAIQKKKHKLLQTLLLSAVVGPLAQTGVRVCCYHDTEPQEETSATTSSFSPIIWKGLILPAKQLRAADCHLRVTNHSLVFSPPIWWALCLHLPLLSAERVGCSWEDAENNNLRVSVQAYIHLQSLKMECAGLRFQNIL